MHTAVLRLGALLVLMLTVGDWSDVLQVLITFLGEAVCLLPSQDLLQAELMVCLNHLSLFCTIASTTRLLLYLVYTCNFLVMLRSLKMTDNIECHAFFRRRTQALTYPVTKQGNAHGKHHQMTADGVPEIYLKHSNDKMC